MGNIVDTYRYLIFWHWACIYRHWACI